MTPLLKITGLTVTKGAIPLFSDLSLSVGANEAVALVGSNGAGKSSLIRAIMGLERKAAGTVVFDGRPLDSLGASARARAGIGYCPEGRRVFPGLSVRENLDVASFAATIETKRRRDRVFAIFPDLAERHAVAGWQLSGGQQQMLAIGRALMGQPRLLLLDEPSLGLSPLLTQDVLGRIPGIVAGGTAVLIAEQNVATALKVVDRAYVLNLGQITMAGAAAELAGDSRVVAALLGGGDSRR